MLKTDARKVYAPRIDVAPNTYSVTPIVMHFLKTAENIFVTGAYVRFTGPVEDKKVILTGAAPDTSSTYRIGRILSEALKPVSVKTIDNGYKYEFPEPYLITKGSAFVLAMMKDTGLGTSHRDFRQYLSDSGAVGESRKNGDISWIGSSRINFGYYNDLEKYVNTRTLYYPNAAYNIVAEYALA